MESSSSHSITALCGGLGGARLALALGARCSQTTFITNVGDDWSVGGLLVCPDTDAVLYALAGIFDEERGWGIRDDEFPGPLPGEPDWFGLGVQDRRHHQRRDALLQTHSLASATSELSLSLGIGARVIPATSSPNPTRVVTAGGELAFQEWLVRDRAQPGVVALDWPGAVDARPAEGVLDALIDAEVLVVSSSSPMASIEPSLRVPGILDALVDRKARGSATVVISPIVAGRTPHVPRDIHRAHARAALMRASGIDADPVGAATWAASWASHFVLDPADSDLVSIVRRIGLAVEVAPILDQDALSRADLVEAILSPIRRSV